MKRIIRKIKSFFLLEVQNESETKDLAVLIRVLTSIYFLYYLFVIVILSSMSYFLLSLILLLFTGILVGGFICTYEDKTKLGLRIFSCSIIICASVLTIFTGWHMNFQWSILVAILVDFYSLDVEKQSRFRNTKLLFTLLAGICAISQFLPILKEPSSIMRVSFQLLNTLFYGAVFSAIAYCYSTKFNQAEKKLRKINQHLMQMASLDSLTQLKNRRSMNEHLSTLVYDFNRIGTPFCIAIADVDHFKKVNDEYGHDTGDYILTSIAEIFRETMDGKGCISRWGGEEFLFSFEGMNGQQAFSYLEVLRIRIANTSFHHKDSEVHITVTFGLEEYSQLTGIESTISKADQKLYQGKTSGRNKIVF